MLRQKFGWHRIIAVLALALVPLVLVHTAWADMLPNRSVQLLDSKANAITDHLFSFDLQTSSMVGSIVFEYCVNNPFIAAPCTAPNGFDASGASLNFESGETGFSIDAATTANRLVISRPPAMTVPNSLQYVFGNVVNPSDQGTVYVRITLHASTDGTGPNSDQGAVAFSIVAALSTVAYVPPYLSFCVGITVASDCSSSTGFSIDLGELSTVSPSSGTSQYAGATNDLTGFSVSMHGTSLTSGNNIIPAITAQNPSIPGTSQFGVNLRDNSNPDVGLDPTGAGTSAPNPDYFSPDNFLFNTGDNLSSVLTPSEYNVFTVSYVVNISPAQPAGIYNTTFTYIAVASF